MAKVQTMKGMSKADSGRGFGRGREEEYTVGRISNPELEERGKKNACIVVFIICPPSFCCICEMKEGDEQGRRRTRMAGGVEGRQEGREGRRGRGKKKTGGEAVKLIFCASPYTATDMLRQKPGPEVAAWV